MSRALSAATYILVCGIGLMAFLYPFWLPQLQGAGTANAQISHTQDAPWITLLLIGFALLALFLDAQANLLNAKIIALLGVLVAMNSMLRFIEVGIPGPGGFTPVFFLIILCGYAFGARFGFLMGALSLLISALITAGVGPWLPYQMFTAGWMGIGAAGLARGLRWLQIDPYAGVSRALLVCFGLASGFAYGAVMNIWFWPFASGPAQQYWQAGLGFGETLQRYAVFYAATSLLWDTFAALGNAVLLALFGLPTLRVLLRFKARFFFVQHV